ncbi:hypothetical protein PIB30_013389 [Stylosanthes scabra]|uniref:Replication factor A C-terminal domain-containing protein n=1 Tax=Stylosanthes scabra TaxID=79078 RepID=A0ABU6W7I0_9FABA|nr:hypothetical protein [Stylosanthes scabra]
MNSGKTSWCYKGCIKCPKKVEPKENNMWECTRCNKITSGYTYRYKVEIVAYDDTATITLLLWDNEVADLVGIKAQTLKESMEGDKEGYPSVLDELFEKRLLFKIKVQSENISGEDAVFRVMKICDDEDNKSENNPDDHLDRSVTSTKGKTPTRLSVDVDGIVTRGKKIAYDEGQLSTNKFSRKMPKKAKTQNLDADE